MLLIKVDAQQLPPSACCMQQPMATLRRVTAGMEPAQRAEEAGGEAAAAAQRLSRNL